MTQTPRRQSLRPALLGALLAAATSTLILADVPGATAQTPGSKFSGLQVSGDKPIAIESDQLDVEDAKAIATFTGNVSVAQGETQLKASKLIVHYVKSSPDDAAGKADAAKTETPKPAASGPSVMPGSSNQIERLEASGKVYVKSTDQVATADAADFNMKTQIAVLTGNVVLSQGDNVARGDRLTIHMDTGVAQLGGGGRVKLLLAPSQGQPQAGAKAKTP